MRCLRGIIVSAVLPPAFILGILSSGCSRPSHGWPESEKLRETVLVIDIGSSGDLRIDGASVSLDQLSRILDRRNEPGLVLKLRIARDVASSSLVNIMELAREKQLSEVCAVFTGLTIDDLTKPFETNDFIVVD